MAATIRDVFAYVINALGTDGTMQSLGIDSNDIYALKVPESHPTPYIVMERNAAQYHYPLGTGSEQAIYHWVVIKVVCDGNSSGDDARRIMDRVRAILTPAVATLTSGTMARALAVSDLEYAEEENGNILFLHIGTQFKFILTD